MATPIQHYSIRLRTTLDGDTLLHYRIVILSWGLSEMA